MGFHWPPYRCTRRRAPPRDCRFPSRSILDPRCARRRRRARLGNQAGFEPATPGCWPVLYQMSYWYPFFSGGSDPAAGHSDETPCGVTGCRAADTEEGTRWNRTYIQDITCAYSSPPSFARGLNVERRGPDAHGQNDSGLGENLRGRGTSCEVFAISEEQPGCRRRGGPRALRCSSPACRTRPGTLARPCQGRWSLRCSGLGRRTASQWVPFFLGVEWGKWMGRRNSGATRAPATGRAVAKNNAPRRGVKGHNAD